MEFRKLQRYVTGRKIVIPKEDINYDYQESYFEHDKYTNDAANVKKFNRHLIMNSGKLEKALQKMMVCKTCHRQVHIRGKFS